MATSGPGVESPGEDTPEAPLEYCRQRSGLEQRPGDRVADRPFWRKKWLRVRAFIASFVLRKSALVVRDSKEGGRRVERGCGGSPVATRVVVAGERCGGLGFARHQFDIISVYELGLLAGV